MMNLVASVVAGCTWPDGSLAGLGQISSALSGMAAVLGQVIGDVRVASAKVTSPNTGVGAESFAAFSGVVLAALEQLQQACAGLASSVDNLIAQKQAAWIQIAASMVFLVASFFVAQALAAWTLGSSEADFWLLVRTEGMSLRLFIRLLAKGVLEGLWFGAGMDTVGQLSRILTGAQHGFSITELLKAGGEGAVAGLVMTGLSGAARFGGRTEVGQTLFGLMDGTIKDGNPNALDKLAGFGVRVGVNSATGFAGNLASQAVFDDGNVNVTQAGTFAVGMAVMGEGMARLTPHGHPAAPDTTDPAAGTTDRAGISSTEALSAVDRPRSSVQEALATSFPGRPDSGPEPSAAAPAPGHPVADSLTPVSATGPADINASVPVRTDLASATVRDPATADPLTPVPPASAPHGDPANPLPLITAGHEAPPLLADHPDTPIAAQPSSPDPADSGGAGSHTSADLAGRTQDDLTGHSGTGPQPDHQTTPQADPQPAPSTEHPAGADPALAGTPADSGATGDTGVPEGGPPAEGPPAQSPPAQGGTNSAADALPDEAVPAAAANESPPGIRDLLSNTGHDPALPARGRHAATTDESAEGGRDAGPAGQPPTGDGSGAAHDRLEPAANAAETSRTRSSDDPAAATGRHPGSRDDRPGETPGTRPHATDPSSRQPAGNGQDRYNEWRAGQGAELRDKAVNDAVREFDVAGHSKIIDDLRRAYEVPREHFAPFVNEVAGRMLEDFKAQVAENPAHKFLFNGRDGTVLGLAIEGRDPEFFREHGVYVTISRQLGEAALQDAEARGGSPLLGKPFRWYGTDPANVVDASIRMRRYLQSLGVPIDRPGSVVTIVDSSFKGTVQEMLAALYPDTEFSGAYIWHGASELDPHPGTKQGYVQNLSADRDRSDRGAIWETLSYEDSMGGPLSSPARFGPDGLPEQHRSSLDGDPLKDLNPVRVAEPYTDGKFRDMVRYLNQRAVGDYARWIAGLPEQDAQLVLREGAATYRSEVWNWWRGDGYVHPDFRERLDSFVRGPGWEQNAKLATYISDHRLDQEQALRLWQELDRLPNPEAKRAFVAGLR
jgi:hypothetical protein